METRIFALVTLLFMLFSLTACGRERKLTYIDKLCPELTENIYCTMSEEEINYILGKRYEKTMKLILWTSTTFIMLAPLEI